MLPPGGTPTSPGQLEGTGSGQSHTARQAALLAQSRLFSCISEEAGHGTSPTRPCPLLTAAAPSGGSGAHPGTGSGSEAERRPQFPQQEHRPSQERLGTALGCRTERGRTTPHRRGGSYKPHWATEKIEAREQTECCRPPRAHTLTLRIPAGLPPARAPRLLGRQPPLTHTLVTLFRPDMVTHQPACWEDSSM